MKILYIVDKFPTLSETFVFDQVVGLIDRGHDVRVVSWAAKGDVLSPKFSPYNLDHHVIEMNPAFPKALSLRYINALNKMSRLIVSQFRKVRRLFSPKYGKLSYGLSPLYVASALNGIEWKTDAVIAHFGTNGLIVSALKNANYIAKETPCFTFFHAYEISGFSEKKLSKIYKPMMLDGSIFLPISQLWSNKLSKAGVSEANLHISHMGVNTNLLHYKKRKIDNKRLHIVSVGRLVEKKGHEYAIKAVHQLLKTVDCEVQYDIIGDGPLHSNLSSLIQELKLEDHIHMRGALSHENVRAILEKADIFMLPSVTSSSNDMEGIPVALMEAMACGLICVSTFHSGIPELITNRVSGYLCRERNVEDLVIALKEILNASQSEIDCITLEAREKVEREFDQGKLLDELIDIMQSYMPKTVS